MVSLSSAKRLFRLKKKLKVADSYELPPAVPPKTGLATLTTPNLRSRQTPWIGFIGATDSYEGLPPPVPPKTRRLATLSTPNLRSAHTPWIGTTDSYEGLPPPIPQKSDPATLSPPNLRSGQTPPIGTIDRDSESEIGGGLVYPAIIATPRTDDCNKGKLRLPRV